MASSLRDKKRGTGQRTEMDASLAVGFGISRREDVTMLVGKAQMAVIGTATIRMVDELGPDAVGPFIKGLLPR